MRAISIYFSKNGRLAHLDSAPTKIQNELCWIPNLDDMLLSEAT